MKTFCDYSANEYNLTVWTEMLLNFCVTFMYLTLELQHSFGQLEILPV